MTDIGKQIDLIGQYLNVSVAKHSVHSTNVANLETPNWRALVPSFKAKLDQAMNNGEQASGLFKNQGPKWDLSMKVQKSADMPREDGNNVVLHNEMSAIAENSLKYSAAIEILTREMALVAYALQSR